ncbi:MAG: restriction endonuclease subunit S [Candidatus Rokuibacteriota bacterium]
MSDRPPAPGWAEAQLGEVVDILDSLRVPVNSSERARRHGPVPYYGATGQVGWIDGHLFDEELVLLGEDGAPFLDSTKPKAYVVRGRSWVNNHAHVLRCRAGMPSAFLKFQLDQLDYHGFVSGTTRLKLSQAPMRRLPLRLPPLEEQRRIAVAIESYVSRLDRAAALLQRVRRNLGRYRAAALRAAVEGRLVPRLSWPGLRGATTSPRTSCSSAFSPSAGGDAKK